MSLLEAERIKLVSTRSPWWCALLAIALPIGFAAILAASNVPEVPLTVASSQAATNLGQSVVLVMAAIAVTTEYRFGTIRSTFQAVPGRVPVLLAKTVVVAVLAGIIGEIAAFGSWGISRLIRPSVDLSLTSGADWRSVAGNGLVYALTAVLALGVGLLVRQTAGAIALLLVYSLLVEQLVLLIPKVGEDIQRWMPFFAAQRFIDADPTAARTDLPLGPWGYLAYFAGIALVVLAAGIASAVKRDA